jgi:arylsulfatase
MPPHRAAPTAPLARARVAPGFGRLAAAPVVAALFSCRPDAPAPAPAPAPAAPGSAPDIVLVLIDTLRADHLHSHGYPRPTSPRMDALAAEGRRYARAYAHAGWTLASATSLLTGLYPHQHGVVRDGCQPDAYGALSPDDPSLARALQASGWRTGAWANNTFLAPAFGLHHGFDRYDYRGASNQQHRTAVDTVDEALAWLDDGGPAAPPTFLLVHLMEPHLDYVPAPDLAGTFTPGEPPPRMVERDGQNPFSLVATRQLDPDAAERAWLIGRYDEELLTVDRAVGRLVDGLRDRGRLDRTVLVVTADHGEELWDHGGFEHGHALWSALTHVPLIVRGPGFPVGVDEGIVEHIDLTATLAGVAGVSLGPGAAGRELRRPDRPPRAAMSENCLYGPACMSLIDGAHRLVLTHELVPDPDAPADLSRAKAMPLAELWAVDAAGADRERVPNAQAEALAAPLLTELSARRGGLHPLAARGGAVVPDAATFDLLRSLGYVDRPDGAARPQTPCR